MRTELTASLCHLPCCRIVFLRHDFLGWKLDADAGSLADLACELQLAAVQFRQAPGEREAEAGAFMGAVRFRLNMTEGFEDLFHILVGDADAVVLDLDAEVVRQNWAAF